MCGRFSLGYDLEDVVKRFPISSASLTFKPRYNIAPSQELIAIVNWQGKHQILSMSWGLIPFWSKQKQPAHPLINVRSENLTEKPIFKRYFERQRCLVPADGFFEWKKEGTRKIPYRAIVKNQSIFAFAGLWDQFQRADGSFSYCLALLTTEANSLIAPIHQRMPVILTPSTEEAWLDPAVHSQKELNALLKPLPSSQMEIYEVSPQVNSWKHDEPDCISKINQYP